MHGRRESEPTRSITAFSRLNPPPSIEEAQLRFDNVLYTEENIGIQIELSNPDDHETDDEYDSWRSRALAAMTHARIERKYLEYWIKEATAAQKKHDNDVRSRAMNPQTIARVKSTGGATDSKSDQTLSDAAEKAFDKMVERATVVAKSFNERFAPRYSIANPPSDAYNTETRFYQLIDAECEVGSYFVKLREECAQAGLGETRQARIRKIVSPIVATLRIEREYMESILEGYGLLEPVDTAFTKLVDLALVRSIDIPYSYIILSNKFKAKARHQVT